MRPRTLLAAFAILLPVALLAQNASHEARAKEIFKQLVEINTTHSVGSSTAAAEAMGARF